MHPWKQPGVWMPFVATNLLPCRWTQSKEANIPFIFSSPSSSLTGIEDLVCQLQNITKTTTTALSLGHDLHLFQMWPYLSQKKKKILLNWVNSGDYSLLKNISVNNMLAWEKSHHKVGWNKKILTITYNLHPAPQNASLHKYLYFLTYSSFYSSNWVKGKWITF